MFTRDARTLAGMLGAVAVALYAQAASAQVAPPYGLPDRGVLRLQLGSTVTSGGLHSPRRFVHEPSGLSQAINKSGNCGLALGGPTALATMSALGGNGSLGLGTTSIGVYNGSTGTACYTITASLGESVTVGLGSGMSSSQIDANAFYRVVLDLEVKKNAEFLLQVLAGGAVSEEFRMRTGGSIVAGEGSASPGSPDHIFNCSARSDSGPDAGIGDNCRWDVSSLGNSFRLIALQGEGSLEGGGDWGSAAYANNSLVYLTKGNIGAMGCETSSVPQGTDTGTIGDGVNTAQCGVTRIDPTGLGGSCTTAVGYVFRSIDGADEGCEIIKTPSEQLAASVDITFPPEPSTALGAEPLTRIQFATNVPNQFVDFTPARCIGTVVNDHNGNPTILEVLSNPNFVADVVPATPQKDWACVLNSATEYIGSSQMRITQTILFWGDINFTRQ